MTRTLDDALSKHLALMASLETIPGVVGVGFGLKERGGEPTGEWGYRVYVRQKLWLGDLSREERIPTEVDGVPTDVLACLPSFHESCTRSLAPGHQITRFMGANSPQGTLGVLARRAATRFIVTNEHVLHPRNTISSKDVYDPERKTVGTKTFHVDVGLAEVNAGINCANVIEKVGPLDAGTRDLSTLTVNAAGQPNEVVLVRKRGAATGLTVGSVTQLFRLRQDPANPAAPPIPVFELMITPEPGNGFDYDQEVHVPASADVTGILAAFPSGGRVHVVKNVARLDGSRVLRFKGQVFAKEGDSGAPLVDSARRLVGLVHGRAKVEVAVVDQTETQEVLTGPGFACFIEPCLQAVGLTSSSIVPPGTPLAGEALLASGSAISVQLDERPALRALEELRPRLECTPAGRRLLSLVPHVAEIIGLVRHRRRVTVVWQRAHGPAFAAAFLRALSKSGPTLPERIGEVRRADALARLRDVLLQEGSDSLRHWLVDHGDWLLALAVRSSSIDDLHDVLARKEISWTPGSTPSASSTPVSTRSAS
jgi:hypothetical protein